MPFLRKVMHGMMQGAMHNVSHGPTTSMQPTGHGHSSYSAAPLGYASTYGAPMANPYGGAMSSPISGPMGVGGFGGPASVVRRDITLMYDRRSGREAQSGGYATTSQAGYGVSSTFMQEGYGQQANMFGGGGGGATVQDWEQAQQAVMHLCDKVKTVDPDGISLYVYSDDGSLYRQGNVAPTFCNNLKSKAQTSDILCAYQPQGHTPMHTVLETAFANFWRDLPNNQAKGKRGETFISFTDGKPDDEVSVYQSIINMTHEMQRRGLRDEDVGLVFLQIGNDPEASRFLWELDNNLRAQGAVYDIVDTKRVSDLQGISLPQLLEEALRG